MFVKSLHYVLKSLAAKSACTLSIFTMVFSPVAMGHESETLNDKQIQSYVEEFGLNKKETLGEFWEKSKAYYPAAIYKDFEKFVQENKNVRMPEVNVTTAKATDGTTVPVLRITSSGHSTTLQFYGEKNKWAKFNNVTLSENDLKNVGAVFKRVEASDIRIKTEADRYREGKSPKKSNVIDAATKKQNEKVIQDFARFKGFPRVSPAQWKQMTPTERAGFIVNMRLLWKDARQVLKVQAAHESKTPPKGRKFSSFEEFSKILLGEEAEAGAKKPDASSSQSMPAPAPDDAPSLPTGSGPAPSGTQPAPTTPQSVVNPGLASAPNNPQDKKCIVAGYVSLEGTGSNYGSGPRRTCSEDMVFESKKYKEPAMEAVNEAKFECFSKGGANSIACNPLVYGYNSDGNSICVDRTQKTPSAPAQGNFQKASWWDGPCDSASKLTSEQIQDGMKVTDKVYKEDDKRYDKDGKLKGEVAQQQINRVEENQLKNDSFKATKDYLDNVLKHKTTKGGEKLSIDDLISGKKPWSKEVDDMLVDIQGAFENEIGEAIQSCENSVERKDNVDKNQKGACDQLHRRWLFTERFISKFREKSCLGGSTYIWKMDDTALSKDQVARAVINKDKVKHQDLMCRCSNQPSKKIKFNDAKSCPSIVETNHCPAGLDWHEGDMCSCHGSSDMMTADVANQRASLEGVEKMCEKKCDQPKGIEGFDYKTCDCIEGSLKDENGQGFVSKIFHHDEEQKAPKMVCKSALIWPWVVGGLAAAGILFAIFNRHKGKNDRPTPTPTPTPTPPVPTPPPVVVVPPTCAPRQGTYPDCISCQTASSCVVGQQIYNFLTCQCDTKVQPIICDNGSVQTGNACPKCSDGSYQTVASSFRPGGCPSTSEGGDKTRVCTDSSGKVISCSGGVPTGQ